jgi:hypothetical protein
MAEYLIQFGIVTLCFVWIPLGVLALKLRRKVVSLRATVKTLQNQVDQLTQRNLLLVLKRREEALDSVSKPQAPKSESAEVLPLKLQHQ